MKTKKSPFTKADMEFALKIFRNPQAITGHNLVNPLAYVKLDNPQLITILRNPILRCASHYQDLVTRNHMKASFQEWISLENNQNLSVKTIAGSDDLEYAKNMLFEKYTFVGITEHFEESVKLLKLSVKPELDIRYRKMIVAADNTIKTRLLSDTNSMLLLKKYNTLDEQLYDFALEKIFNRKLEEQKENLSKIKLQGQTRTWWEERTLRKSKRFNDFAYRQMIKVISK